MSLKEIFRKKEVPYDPVHAHVPGVNERWTQNLREEFINGGDPMPKPEPLKEEIIFKLPGIRLVRTTRAK